VAESSHEYFDLLCAMAAASQTSPEEDLRLAEHLQSCAVCKDAFDQYKQILAYMCAEGAANAAANESRHFTADEIVEQLRAKQRLLARTSKVVHLPLTGERPGAILKQRKSEPRKLSFHRVPSWASWAVAAALLVAAGVGPAQYWASRAHSRNLETRSASLQRELEELRGELAQVQAKHLEGAMTEQAQTRHDETEKLRAGNESLRKSLATNEAARRRVAGEYAELQERARLLQSSIEVLQASNGDLMAGKTELAEKISNLTTDLRTSQGEMARLEARNAELSQEQLVRLRSAERQQKLLATDHDIRDILGARSLHIIDVFDVNGQGELERPFGRIFYTEGKSLIFYAFDLAQQKGLKRGAIFQAWGQRGEGQEAARNLGVFYMDDPLQNRWVLKVDDGKMLSRIDYVFVTDSSRKETVRPKGRPILSAFLEGTPNHP
jgi:hypothetical protein